MPAGEAVGDLCLRRRPGHGHLQQLSTLIIVYFNIQIDAWIAAMQADE